MTPLHELGDALRSWLSAIPLSAARMLFVATLFVLLIWVWRLPKHVTAPPGGARRWDENLKIGATAALVIQIVIYCIF
jgi:hypothetical protein